MADQTPSPTPRTTAGLAGCPNTPPCEHPAMIHDVSGDPEDPKPMCCADGCSCGQPTPELAAEPGPLPFALLTIAGPFDEPAVHIAGPPITINGRYQRQLCAWCGHRLLDYDLANVAVPDDQPGPPATFPAGRLIQVIGAMAVTLEQGDGDELPDGCCANPDDEPELCGKHVAGTSSNRCLLRAGHTDDCSDEFADPGPDEAQEARAAADWPETAGVDHD